MPFKKTTALAIVMAGVPLALQGYQLDQEQTDAPRFQAQTAGRVITSTHPVQPRFELLRPRTPTRPTPVNANRTLQLPLATYRQPPASVLF